MMIILICPGDWFDPFNQNVFKGDYPIFGQHTFLDISATASLDFEGRQIPTQTSGFESTERPFSGNFFGRPNSFFTLDFFSLSFDLFHGDGAFKPVDWRIKLVPTLGVSNFSFSELAQTSPNVLQGTTRTRDVWALQEAFAEYKLADLGPDYDFVSVRAGNQPFNADFRGFLFSDINRARPALRHAGTRIATSSTWRTSASGRKTPTPRLNTFNDRGQNLFFANYYRQDFIFPGYTAQVSLNYDNDPASIKFDKNRFLVRPDPVGNFQPHEVNVGLLRPGGRRALGPVQPDEPVLLGVRPRQHEPAGQPPADDQCTDGGDRGLVRPRLGAVPPVVLLRLGRRQRQRLARHRVRHDPRSAQLRRRPVQLLEPAADRPARGQPGAAAQPGARPALQQDPGAGQLRQPRA